MYEQIHFTKTLTKKNTRSTLTVRILASTKNILVTEQRLTTNGCVYFNCVLVLICSSSKFCPHPHSTGKIYKG